VPAIGYLSIDELVPMIAVQYGKLVRYYWTWWEKSKFSYLNWMIRWKI